MVAAGKLVLYIIAIAVGLALFFAWYSGSGAFEKLKEGVKGTEEYLPNAFVGAKELTADVSIPKEHDQQISTLQQTIKEMLSSTNKNCFANYGGFSELNEKGTSISMEYDYETEETIFSIFGGAGGKQLLTDKRVRIKEMKPCVIAGSSSVTKNFDTSFLNTNNQKNIVAGHFNPVQKIVIAYDTSGINENRINYGTGFKDFEDASYIYTPDNSHICFFPTVDGNNICDGSSEDGLDDDCLGEHPEEDIAIPRQVRENKLQSCI